MYGFDRPISRQVLTHQMQSIINIPGMEFQPIHGYFRIVLGGLESRRSKFGARLGVGKDPQRAVLGKGVIVLDLPSRHVASIPRRSAP